MEIFQDNVFFISKCWFFEILSSMHVDFWQAEQQSTKIVLVKKVLGNCLVDSIILVCLWSHETSKNFLISTNSQQAFPGANSQWKHYFFSLFPKQNNVEFNFGSLEKSILIRSSFFLHFHTNKKKLLSKNTFSWKLFLSVFRCLKVQFRMLHPLRKI